MSEILDADGNVHDVNPTTRYLAYYHSAGLAPKMMEAWNVIAIALIEAFRPDNVLDLGCSGGSLVKRLLAHGVAAIGVDGSKSALDVCKDILIHDLRMKEDIPWKPATFDLVTCFDTAEHLESEHAHTICTLCAEAVRPGGTVCFGAATPGQGGLGHVTLEPPEFWRAILQANGLVFDEPVTLSLKQKLHNTAAGEAWWVEKNVQVFHKPV